MILEEESKVKKALKRLLKARGIAYQQVADELCVSLPTVRRFMSQERISFERIVQICQLLEITVDELMAVALKADPEYSFFTLEQEKFFCKNPAHYLLLRALGRGMTVSEIMSEFQLSEKSVEKYLIKLETLNLIRRKNGVPRLLIKWPVNMRFPGPMQEAFFPRISQDFLEHLNQKTLRDLAKWSETFYHYLNAFSLSEKNYRAFVKELNELNVRISHQSKVDRNSYHWKQLVHGNALCGIDKYDAFSSIGKVKPL